MENAIYPHLVARIILEGSYNLTVKVFHNKYWTVAWLI